MGLCCVQSWMLWAGCFWRFFGQQEASVVVNTSSKAYGSLNTFTAADRLSKEDMLLKYVQKCHFLQQKSFNLFDPVSKYVQR